MLFASSSSSEAVEEDVGLSRERVLARRDNNFTDRVGISGKSVPGYLGTSSSSVGEDVLLSVLVAKERV